MHSDVVIGIVLLACSLGLLTFLTFWSRSRINRISRSGARSARRIEEDMDHG